MSWYSIFYWLTVADNFRHVLFVFAIICTILTVISFGCFLFGRDGDLEASPNSLAERAKRWVWWGTPIIIVLWLVWSLLPSKRDALLIVAGGGALEFLTTDSSAKKLPSELTNFVVGELQVMAKDAKLELAGLNSKEMILDKAKTMTADELMKAMKADTSFANVILDR